MIPNEILLDNVVPYLSLSAKTRMTAISQFFHHHLKRQDKAKYLPRAVSVITIWDELAGGFDPIQQHDLYTTLASFPFYMEPQIRIAKGVRSWEPIFSFRNDLSETFFKKDDRSVIKGIEYSFQFRDDEITMDTMAHIQVSRLCVTAKETDPEFVIGLCESEQQKSSFLFGVKKGTKYEITTAMTTTHIYPPHILEFQTVLLPEQSIHERWEHIPPEPVTINLFGIYELDPSGF